MPRQRKAAAEPGEDGRRTRWLFANGLTIPDYLTPCEERVIDCLMEAQDIRAIARTLGVARSTVKHHIVNIGAKWLIDTSRYDLRNRIVYLNCLRIGRIRLA